MNEFDVILDECVDLVASGESTIDECLSSYPEYAAQLEPVLITLLCLQEEGRDVLPPPGLRSRIRDELELSMKKIPQKKSRLSVFFWRKTLGIATLLVALMVTHAAFTQ
jgi:hypothetical protein